ncbi:MAG: hypothetical protein Q8Q02_09530 [Nocardioides sp.]|nr:hypothetical protein [Nocardioides sp.]
MLRLWVLRENGFARVRREGTRRLYAVEAAPLQEWTPPDDRGYSDQVEIRLTSEGPSATWLELEHASVADGFRNEPETGC